MNTYIITYDLVQPGQNYESLLRKIKLYPQWARLGGSCYVIFTTQKPVEIRENLTSVLDVNDKLFVGKVSAPAAWFNLGSEVSNWLRDKLE
ncbi:hypothetical protein [uncultured Alistipes sp.]|uniref:hypothetical protein n=1 Tax=uncultured Alistipes sp. TaxID=538949 RepID=UPI002593EBE6|nr:hypothetical protein [uncultured Alistipes sp.]